MNEGDKTARQTETPPEDSGSTPEAEASTGGGEAARDADKTTPDTDAPPDPDPAERDSALGAAILRIGASLDLDTVLAEVVESARALTGAAYGVIATVDEAGTPRDFVTSGFAEQEHRAMEAWPDGHRLFGHLHDWARRSGCPTSTPGCARSAAPPSRCPAGRSRQRR